MEEVRKKKIGRRDVARLAGVSLTTVTHALNRTPGKNVKDETIEKIERAASKLGYMPNFFGKALVSGRTFTVGLIQPFYSSVSYRFYQEIIIGMAEAMEPDDYNLLMMFRSSNPRQHMRPIEQGRLDGVIILQSDMDEKCIRQVLETGIPTVVANARFDLPESAAAGNVYSDHDSMMRNVLDEFLSLGCRSVLAVHDYRYCSANRIMFESFVKYAEALSKKGVSGMTIVPSHEDFRSQMRNLFQSGQRYDGIFVDGVQFGDIIHEEAERAGLKTGTDFHLITCGLKDGEHTAAGVEASAYNQQPHEIGRQAWRILKGLISGEECPRMALLPYVRNKIITPAIKRKQR